MAADDQLELTDYVMNTYQDDDFEDVASQVFVERHVKKQNEDA